MWWQKVLHTSKSDKLSVTNPASFNRYVTCFSIFPPFIIRLRAETSEKQLEELARRARKLQGDRLALEDFAQFLNLPVTDTLTHIHRLFDQVNTHAGGVKLTVVVSQMWQNNAKSISFTKSVHLFAVCRRANRHQAFCHRPLDNLPTKVDEDAQISLLGEDVHHQVQHTSM